MAADGRESGAFPSRDPQVHLPAPAPWLEQFKRELLSFPASTNDDQVDALSQLLNWLRFRTNTMVLQSSYGGR